MRDFAPADPGLHLHHGNRLERLGDELARQLAGGQPDPLTSDQVLVPHPGMAQWLKMHLADRLGIAASIEFPLPATWLGRLAAVGLSRNDVLAWGRDALSWRLYAMQLPALSHSDATGEQFEDRRALARWQWARQTAQLFERYILQRPEWVGAWCEGRLIGMDRAVETWQAQAWRHLYAQATVDQRLALKRRLDMRSVPTAALPHRLFVFGFASLPRLYIANLDAIALHVPVHVFFPNPCRWYWGDLLAEREQLAKTRRLHYKPALDPAAEGHPLLASMGTVGRDFLHQLYQDIELASEQEAFDDVEGVSILSQLQSRILDLDDAPVRWRSDDRSLRVVRAPSMRREVEAIHDVLLGLLDDPSLGVQPHQIVMMVPKLSDYAPVIDAVFGSQPRDTRIPWHVTDLTDADRHPLTGLYLKLLDLPNWRFALSEVMDALSRPAVAAAFSIAIEELPRLSVLLEESGARWGLDREFKAGRDTGGAEEFTFRFAIDRLVAGWLLGEDVAFVDGIAPYARLRNADVDLIGRFVACLERMDHWRVRLQQPRTLSEWAHELSDLRQAFLADSGDDAEDAACLRIIAALERWQAQIESTPDVVVPRRVIREAIAESLRSNAVSALPGEGVNVCAMVPLRSLPFRIVVLLGLGDGDFPRRDRDHPDDLCHRHPRPGDRSLGAEDRYLFLEAIGAARDVLVLSHVDIDGESGQIRPASSIVSEFMDHLRDVAVDENDDVIDPDDRVEHVTASPGDLRHYVENSDARYVPSYARDWLPAAPRRVRAAPVSLEPTLPERWSDLRALLLEPARTQLRWRGVDLRAREEPRVDDEPFDLDGLAAYRVRSFLLETIQDTTRVPDRDRIFDQLQAAALLPVGRSSRIHFDPIWSEVERIHRTHVHVVGDRTLSTIDGRVTIGGVEISARIPSVDEAGLIRVTAGRIDGKRRLGAWLDVLALSLIKGHARLTATLVGLEAAVTLPAPDDPLATLHRLLDLWQRARAGVVPLYPKSSAAYAEQWIKSDGDARKANAEARKLWEGDGQRRAGESADPACAEVAKCFDRFDADPFAELAVSVFGPVYRQTLA